MKKALCFAAVSTGAWLAGTAVASAQEASPPSEQPPTRPHTVDAGESLSKISQAELGTSQRWVEIFAVNRDAVADPDVIEVGQVLAIPSGPVAVPTELVASLASEPAAAPTPAPVVRHQAATTASQVRTARQATTPTRARRSRVGGAGGSLAAIRTCESGGNYGAVSANGRYRGAYQFDQQTWQSVGGTGDPAAASPAEQDTRASQLRSQRGSNPWPTCG